MYKNDVIGSPNKGYAKDQEKLPTGKDETAVGLQRIHFMLKEFNNAARNELDSLEYRMKCISKVADDTYQNVKEPCSTVPGDPNTMIEMIEIECINLESHFSRIKKINDIVNILLSH